MRNDFMITCASAMLLWAPAAPAATPADDVQALKDEVRRLSDRVRELEEQLDQQLDQQPARSRDLMRPPMGPSEDWDPFAEMERVQEQVNRVFRDSFGRRRGLEDRPNLFSGQMPAPDADVKKTPDGYVITMDLPGMDKDKIEVQTKDNMLIVSGERRTETAESRPDRFQRRERSFGSFARAMPLPRDARPERISTEYENGVLTIKIARDESARDAVPAPKAKPEK